MRQRPTFAPQPGSQVDFLNSEATITFYGGAAGSGKTHAILLDMLQHINDPLYFGVIFRENSTQLENGIWREAKSLFFPFKPRIREKNKEMVFKSGATFKFSHMALDKDAESFQGVQITGQYWDEFTHFSQYQFNYLRSRMRSPSQTPSYMKCSMNPDRDHFVFKWIEPYLRTVDVLDGNGNVIPEKAKGTPNRELCAKLRYFVINGNDIHTAWTREELKEAFPALEAESYTFIAG